MDDEEFDQVSQVLFDGVPSLTRIGSPGILIPMTHDTRAVLCGDDSSNVIIVATRFGSGRCLVFAHNGYPEMFLNDETEDQDFVENCRRWLAQGEEAEFVSINEVLSMNEVETDGKILVWDGHETKDDAFMRDLCAYLQQGGALICGTTAWGWLQQNEGKLLSDFPFARFCDYIGVKLTDNTANGPDPILFRPELVEFKNIYRAVQELVNDPTDVTSLAIVGAAIKELGDTLPGVPVETLQNIVMDAGRDVVPVSSCPIRDKSCREHSIGICSIMCALPGIKAPGEYGMITLEGGCHLLFPGVRDFPGDFDQPPRIETNINCRIQSSTSEWFCTGYYVAAGIPIQIDVLEQVGEAGWSARVGCHSDDLGDCDELRRWPCISICKPLIGTQVRLSSAFGGLLFLQSPEGKSNSIAVRLHHVVLTPTYDLTDPNRETSWQSRRREAQGLWADVAGRYIVFNLPSKSVLQMDSAQLDRALQFWDTVVLAHHELRGTQPTNRERIVGDEQPSVGYMHSGYPIVTEMDVCDPQAEGFLLNYLELKEKGAWGLFHELGHNMQRDWWTFEGTVEVTVNIFTLHAMDLLCHRQTWIHPWLQDQISTTRKYIKDGSNFDAWKNDPGIALFIYAQLAREYGWDSYKAVFRQYEQDQPDLQSDQEKMDHWIVTFSRQVGYNLVPLFKFWGIPVSQATVDDLADLETAEISDEFIELAPERYQM